LTQVGLWRISDTGPQKLVSANIGLERDLENWIEQDPNLLEAGLTIVGRQVYVDGGPLDLLAIDPQGSWVAIELKAGPLYRATLTQALDYASSIATLPYDQLMTKVDSYLEKQSHEIQTAARSILDQQALELEQDQPYRDVRIYLVGTTVDPGLERMTTFLANAHGLPTKLVTFQVFEVEGGQRLLLRELTEADTETSMTEGKKRLTVEDVCRQADAELIGAPFRRILEAATALGMYARPYRHSVVYTPPSNRTRTLLLVGTSPDRFGSIRVWVWPEGFSEFYPVSSETAETHLGSSGWHELTDEQVDGFIQGLDRLFSLMDGARD
jgi:Holliday junction resolvase-like predicted endonuclease